VTGPAPSASAQESRAPSPLRWVVLGLAAIAIYSSYYESDAIGPIADLLLRQRGFTQAQIGDLTAVISLPNILLAVFNGLLIDRYGPARVTLWAAAIGFVGAVLTAIGTPYSLMWTGRLIFGISEGAIFIALIAGIARWFPRSGIALATAAFLSLARVGSFSLDTSPTWARSLYEGGWQPPLWLGAGITGVGLIAAIAFRLIDARRPVAAALPGAGSARPDWSALFSFDLSYWYILGLHVLYAAVFFPFRQTYAIEYLQHVKGLTLQQAGNVNSGVFAAAVFATPCFGLLADRFGHRALMLTAGTLLLPLTFMVHRPEPLGLHGAHGSELLAGAGDHLAGHDARRRTTATRYGTGGDRAAAEPRPVGLEPHRRLPRRPRWRRSRQPCRLRHHDLVLRPAEPCRTRLRGTPVAA